MLLPCNQSVRVRQSPYPGFPVGILRGRYDELVILEEGEYVSAHDTAVMASRARKSQYFSHLSPDMG